MYTEGFVQASTAIWLGSLKHVLPKHKMTDAGEIIQVTFEEVLPGPDNDYIFHSTVIVSQNVSGWNLKD